MEWGDTISSALPPEHLSVTIRFGEGDNERSFETAQPRRVLAAPRRSVASRPRALDLAVLILGIESATGRVGCAIGGHEGVRASVQATRERCHAELLAPQIQAACAHADITLQGPWGAVPRSMSARGSTPVCASG